jgi:hypothetical protein
MRDVDAWYAWVRFRCDGPWEGGSGCRKSVTCGRMWAGIEVSCVVA